MIYCKLTGTFGSGKTTLVREMTRFLTGVPADRFSKKETPEGLKYSQCDCGKVIALGKWKETCKCCGIDAISAKEGFKFIDLVKAAKPELDKAMVLFDEGSMNATLNIQTQLIQIFDYNMFLLDIPPEECKRRIFELRGGSIQDKYVFGKYKAHQSYFLQLQTTKKMKINGQTEQNRDYIVNSLGLTRCGCMENKGDGTNVLSPEQPLGLKENAPINNMDKKKSPKQLKMSDWCENDK